MISLVMIAVRSYYKSEFFKKLLLHKRNLYFLSEAAHAFFVVLLLLFAMLLLLTSSDPLQCLAAQKIWNCLDKLHQLSMRISSTESLQGNCCTQNYIGNSRLHPSAIFQILQLNIVSCAS